MSNTSSSHRAKASGGERFANVFSAFVVTVVLVGITTFTIIGFTQGIRARAIESSYESAARPTLTGVIDYAQENEYQAVVLEYGKQPLFEQARQDAVRAEGSDGKYVFQDVSAKTWASISGGGDQASCPSDLDGASCSVASGRLIFVLE